MGKSQKTVCDIICDTIQEMCDNYCRFPDEYAKKNTATVTRGLTSFVMISVLNVRLTN